MALARDDPHQREGGSASQFRVGSSALVVVAAAGRDHRMRDVEEEDDTVRVGVLGKHHLVLKAVRADVHV